MEGYYQEIAHKLFSSFNKVEGLKFQQYGIKLAELDWV